MGHQMYILVGFLTKLDTLLMVRQQRLISSYTGLWKLYNFVLYCKYNILGGEGQHIFVFGDWEALEKTTSTVT